MSEFNNDFAQRYRITLPLRHHPGKQCKQAHIVPYFLAEVSPCAPLSPMILSIESFPTAIELSSASFRSKKPFL
jgi:hypothetical protein